MPWIHIYPPYLQLMFHSKESKKHFHNNFQGIIKIYPKTHHN